jgi:CDP-glucose 4,6-dehydratase
VFNDCYKDKRVLLTGHTGFKGSWLSMWLKLLGAETTGYALDPPTEPSLFDRAKVADTVHDARGDIRDYESVRAVLAEAQPEIIFHMAAQPIVRLSYEEPKATFDTNVGGTVNLLEAARKCATVKAIVVITTDKCYDNREWVHAYRENDALGGHDPYSASKGAAEIVAASYAKSFSNESGVHVATARAGNVVGGGDWASDRILPDAARALEAGKGVPVRNPASIRPWQHVLEPLYGYLLLGSRLLACPNDAQAKEDLAGGWNFAPDVRSCRPVGELIDLFVQHYGSGHWDDLSAHQENAPHEARFLSLAWDKAYRHLGWRPHWDFEETIKRSAEWYAQHAAGADARGLCEEDINAFAAQIGK